MKVRHLSTTLISGWQLCALRAWNSYVTRLEFGNDYHETEPTLFGNVIHEVMEEVFRSDMGGSGVSNVVGLYDETWARRGGTDFDYHTLGRTRIEDFVAKAFADRRQARTIGVELHFCLDVTTGEAWDLTDRPSLDIDELVAGIIRSGGVPVVSKIDRLDFLDGIFYVTDYKTNAQPFTRDEVEKSIQLGIYDLAVRGLFDDVLDVVCTYDMFRHGRFTTTFNSSNREDLRTYLANTWHQIAQTEQLKAKLNQYCHVCEIRGNCYLYADLLESENPVVLTDSADPVAMLEQWERIKAAQKILDERAGELSAMLSTMVTIGDGEPVQIGGDKEIYLSPNPRYNYDTKKVFGLFEKYGAKKMLADVVSISNTALERALKSVPFKDEVLNLKEKGFVKSTLKVRSAKRTIIEEEVE